MWYKIFMVVPIFTFAIILGSGCSKADESKLAELNHVTSEQALAMINSENPPVVIDVRTPEEFNNELGHIPGARLIPMQNTADSMAVYEQFKDRDILLVCRSGRRSGIVGEELVGAGFKHVYNLQGGMNGWNEKSGPVERISGQ